LETLGNLGDFVGGIAVVVTLIYLALQIRQNTQATKVTSMVGVIEFSQQANSRVSSAHLPNVLAKLNRGDQLEAEELVAFTFHVQGIVSNQWQVFYLTQHGMVEDDILAAWERRNSIFMMMPLFQAIWRDLCVGYPNDFQQYMTKAVAALSGSGMASEEAQGEPRESSPLPNE